MEILHGEDIINKDEQNKTVIRLISNENKNVKKWKFGLIISLNIILIIFVGILLLVSMINHTGNRDYQYISVLSDSMNPKIKAGDVVKVKQISDDDKLYVGDVIAFSLHNHELNNFLVTHRIINKYKDDSIGKIVYATKGDNNNNSDSNLITIDDIVGKVTNKVKLSWLFQNTYIKYVLLILIYIIVAIDAFICVIIIKRKKLYRN